jgi:Protein of unknown function (DUF2721)
MPDGSLPGLGLLSAMITPAVLISACGTLIFSTATRLGRIVDRVRVLTLHMEELFTGDARDFAEERKRALDQQIGFYAQRSRLVQGALTCLYLSLGVFVAAVIGIGLTAFAPRLAWVPTALGILGTIVLFAGCVLLIRETRLAVRAVDEEMEFTLRLGRLYQAKHDPKG